MTNLSIILPVFNQGEVLKILHKKLTEALKSLCISYELIFIDDLSVNNSLEILLEIAQQDTRVNILKLKKNVGQANAIYAGLTKVKGIYTLVMDSDLQDKPEDVIGLYNMIVSSNCDMVLAQRNTPNNSTLRNLYSTFFYKVSNLFTKMKHPMGTGVFRIMKSSCFQDIISDPLEAGTVFSQLLMANTSYQLYLTERDLNQEKKSSYSFTKLLWLALNRLIIFPRIPHKTTGVILIATSYILYLNIEQCKSFMFITVILYLLFLLIGKKIVNSFIPHFEEEYYKEQTHE